MLRRLITYLLVIGLFVFCLFVGFFGTVYFGFFGKIPTKSRIANMEQNNASEIFDSQGRLIGSFYQSYRSSVNFDQLPNHLVEALVSTEDARFYDHHGVDYRSLLRVFFKTFLMGDRSAGGGSTITQQLAKNLFPREKHSRFHLAVAKIKEIVVASRVEDLYTKEEILALYFNTVSFPENVYGIQMASRTFFNKDVEDLTLGESACLVGTLKATYTYNPRIFPDRSKGRRNVVLSQMVNYGDLNEDSAEVAMQKPIKLDFHPFTHHDGSAPYFREQVRREILSWLKHDKEASKYNIYTDGLKIYTTLDAGMQKLADSAVRIQMASLQQAFERSWGNLAPWITDQGFLSNVIMQSKPYKSLQKAGLDEKQIMDSLNVKKPTHLFTWEGPMDVQTSMIDSLIHYLKFLQAGFVTLDPSSGAVRTWVGGIDHRFFQFDHVSQSKRQVGSTFKPIVYTAALEEGVRPCDYFSAEQVTYTNMEDWTPANGEEEYTNQNFSMEAALSNSINTVSIKILEKAGLDEVIDLAERMNISSSLPKVPSLALGTAELSMLELAGAYASFVNGSRPVSPYSISKITDASGKVLFQHNAEPLEEAFSENTRQIMVEMLQSVVNDGTASRLRWKYGIKGDIAGKTGTTQSNKDGWFVGITPQLISVSWVGADNPRIGFKETSIGQGANSALPIFGNFYQMINQSPEYRKITTAQFSEPDRRVIAMLNCEPVKEDGFFKKLFTNSEQPKERDFGEKKGGWLKRLFQKDQK